MRPSSQPCIRVAGLALALLATLPAFAAAAPPEISAQPSLQPAFDPAVSDYVTRCSGAPVELSIVAPQGTTVAVDGDGRRSGSFTRSVTLADGQAFSFTVAGESTRTHHVRCLPASFPAFSAHRNGSPQARFYAVTPSLSFAGAPAGVSPTYSALYDNGGAPVWWYDAAPYVPLDAKLLPNGHIAWHHAGGGIQERTFDGTLVRALNTVGFTSDVHELQLLPNGNYLLPIYRPLEHVDLSAVGMPADATILDAVVQELTPAGALVWEWRASDHIPATELPQSWRGPVSSGSAGGSSGGYDIYHLNSIELDGDDLVISFRVLDAVYEVAGSGDGDVVWKLGGVDVPGKSLVVDGDPVLAAPSPDPNGPLAGQHDARILPGGDLTVADNGTHLVGGAWTGRAPRAVRYAIDEGAGTATFVEQATDPDVAQSVCCGSARRLPGGNWVMGWGGRQKVSEQTQGGTRVFDLDFAGPLFSYRANPILPNQLSASTLRSGMDERFARTALSITGASPSFGSVTVATATAPRTFTVTNSGLGTVSISTVTLAGEDGAGFELTGETCAGQTLAADTSCEISARFVSAATGARTATLRVESDAASGPNEAELTATGVPVVTQPATPAVNAPNLPAPFVRRPARSLSAIVTCRDAGGGRRLCTVRGTLRPARSLAALGQRAICTGTVGVRFRFGARTIAFRRVALSRSCAYRTSATFSPPKRRRGALKVRARHGGNRFSTPKLSHTISVRGR